MAQPATEVSRIQDQLQRSVEGGAWHGPALLELLRDLPVDLAPAQPLEHAHSVWEIVLHVTAWQRAILRRLHGEAVELSPEEDCSPVEDCGEAAWSAALRQLRESYQKLAEAIAALPEARLQEKVPGRPHNIYFMLHGLVQHNIYHAGQIALLKKSSR